jgi:hypothetical protein
VEFVDLLVYDRNLSKASCFNEVVVMMGENPASLAN